MMLIRFNDSMKTDTISPEDINLTHLKIVHIISDNSQNLDYSEKNEIKW